MDKRALVLILVLVIAGVALVGWLVMVWEKGKSADEAGNQSAVPAGQPTTEPPPLPIISEFKIKAEKGRFVPNRFKAKRGEQIIINFTAVDDTYDFGFADPKIGFDVVVEKGETRTFGFVAKETGSFIFECIQHCPAEEKMEGVLVITE